MAGHQHKSIDEKVAAEIRALHKPASMTATRAQMAGEARA